MEIIGMLLFAVGAIASIIGGIWYLVECFRQSIWWGLGSLFLPLVELVFLFVHWEVAARPFGVQVAGIVLMFVGAGMSDPNMMAGM